MANAQDPLLSVSMTDFIEYLKHSTIADTHCRLPAIVKYYDRPKNTIIVLPAIKIANLDGTYMSFPEMSMPVHRYGGGGYHISVDISEGDTGDIIFYDRDISNFLELLKETEPATRRVHALEDCEFYPINRIAPESGSGVLITTDSGDVFVNVLRDKVVVTNQSTSLTVNSDNVTITTPVVNVSDHAIFGGDVSVRGGITSEGNMYSSGNLSANSITTRNGATGTFHIVEVVDGIVTGGSNP